ncbi:MAG: response regulator transcription factor [Bacteroidota bacterium]
MIHVALIEDDPDIRKTLALIIDGTPGYSCTHHYPDVESALDPLHSFQPDVVLMDINLPGMSGIEGVKELKEKLPSVDVLMLSIQEDDHSVFESLRMGATGYLVKSTPPTQLLQAIQEVQQGGAPMSAHIARKVLSYFHPSRRSPLTPRESEILRLLCEGQTYSSIGEALFISGHTVRSHIKNIYQKLYVNSRAEAVKKALKDKLI